MLAVARAAGETAPLLFTIGAARKFNTDLFDGPMNALSVQIYQNAQTSFPAAQDRAWGAALTLDRHRVRLHDLRPCRLGTGRQQARRLSHRR